MLKVKMVLYLERRYYLAYLSLRHQHPLMAQDEGCLFSASGLIVPRQTQILLDFELSLLHANVTNGTDSYIMHT